MILAALGVTVMVAGMSLFIILKVAGSKSKLLGDVSGWTMLAGIGLLVLAGLEWLWTAALGAS